MDRRLRHKYPGVMLEKVVEQIPALAVLVFTVVQFLRHQENQADRMLDVLRRHSEAVDALKDEVRKSTDVQARIAALLIAHDATVKGVDPEALRSSEEFIDKALNK